MLRKLFLYVSITKDIDIPVIRTNQIATPLLHGLLSQQCSITLEGFEMAQWQHPDLSPVL